MGALYQGQLFAVGLFDCKINSDVFYFWVEHFFIPELPKHSVIVMDNATFHKRVDTQKLLEQHGHGLRKRKKNGRKIVLTDSFKCFSISV
ncbi:transposase [Acinetobacter sp. EC24]|nr:transposase [Acinetobacter rathckeae]MBF7695742.1 transposase [Acinetobacter rathckeae]